MQRKETHHETVHVRKASCIRHYLSLLVLNAVCCSNILPSNKFCTLQLCHAIYHLMASLIIGLNFSPQFRMTCFVSYFETRKLRTGNWSG